MKIDAQRTAGALGSIRAVRAISGWVDAFHRIYSETVDEDEEAKPATHSGIGATTTTAHRPQKAMRRIRSLSLRVLRKRIQASTGTSSSALKCAAMSSSMVMTGRKKSTG